MLAHTRVCGKRNFVVDTPIREDVTSASMRQWRDCKGSPERQASLVEALAISRGNKSHAAKLLGLSRQHLHRILSDPPRHGLPDDSVALRDSATRGYDTSSVTRRSPESDVTRTTGHSLTYGVSKPTLVSVSTTQAAIESGVAVTLVLPRHCVEWLDLESIRRKHALGHGKSSKAPIVVDLIEREIARQSEGERQSRKVEK